jgi:hypothetical protein
VAALLVATELVVLLSGTWQGSIDRKEIAAYRLTAPVFAQFLEASRRIAIVMAADESFRESPLFSQEIAQGGDIAVVAPTLEARLAGRADLSSALRSASITPREYTKFALTLVAARMAYGFLEAGLLKTVPAGVATDNVSFVRERREAVDDVLAQLGVEIK